MSSVIVCSTVRHRCEQNSLLKSTTYSYREEECRTFGQLFGYFGISGTVQHGQHVTDDAQKPTARARVLVWCAKAVLAPVPEL